jgi:hypothetical protein
MKTNKFKFIKSNQIIFANTTPPKCVNKSASLDFVASITKFVEREIIASFMSHDRRGGVSARIKSYTSGQAGFSCEQK